MNNTHSDTDRLADLIGQKHACLTQLHELGRRQRELIDSGDIGQLLLLLAEKQRAIQLLQHLEGELNPYRGQDPQQRTWSSPALRQHCAGLIEQNEALLREILAQERGGEEQLRRRRDASAERLLEVHWARQARGAYAAEQGGNAHHVDLSSEK